MKAKIIFFIFFLVVNVFSEILTNNFFALERLSNKIIAFYNSGFTLFEGSKLTSNVNYPYPFNLNYESIYYYISGDSLIITANIQGKNYYFFYDQDGHLVDTLHDNWEIGENDKVYDVAIKNDTIFTAHNIFWGFRLFTKDKWYFIEIDTLLGNNKIIDTTSGFFDIDSFYNYQKSKISNLSFGAFFDKDINLFFALTMNGIYYSKDLDVWQQLIPKGLKSQYGIILKKRKFHDKNIYLYRAKNSLGGKLPADTLYKGENTLDGWYISYNILDSLVFVKNLSPMTSLKCNENFLYCLIEDTLFYTDEFNVDFSRWSKKFIDISSNNINDVILFSDSTFILATEDRGLVEGELKSDIYYYYTQNKKLKGSLKEVYAYPTIITSKNPQTTFAYSIPKDDYVTIEIFDFNGDLVKTVIKEELRYADIEKSRSTNVERDIWDGRDYKGKLVEPGTYFFRITTKKTKLKAFGKIIVLKGN